MRRYRSNAHGTVTWANNAFARRIGQPVERSGVTVIPVAKATWGFGGGSGGEAGKEGAGGGGGGFVAPLGYIEVRESGAKFKRIRDPRLHELT